jgi:hypothetical protein
MGYKVYKVQRKTSNDYWYDVMLSPFLRVGDAGKYIKKYGEGYPDDQRVYRVLDDEVDGKNYSRLKSFFGRVPDPLS